jgi:hypothetical protein
MTALHEVENSEAYSKQFASGGSTARREAAACESIEDIMNILVTAEALSVTALARALANAAGGQLALNAEHVQMLTAVHAQELAHYQRLAGMSAKPSTSSFTVQGDVLTDVPTFLKTVIWLEEWSVAAYLAASQEFALINQPALAQLAMSIASVEAEHRVGIRFFAIEAGVLTGIPNDIGFQQAFFTSVGDAAGALRKKGFIGGNGTQITFSGLR